MSEPLQMRKYGIVLTEREQEQLIQVMHEQIPRGILSRYSSRVFAAASLHLIMVVNECRVRSSADVPGRTSVMACHVSWGMQDPACKHSCWPPEGPKQFNMDLQFHCRNDREDHLWHAHRSRQ